jgi:glycolate oxidase FAD binding subunit
MDLTSAVVSPVGARTQWQVAGPPPAGAEEIRAPAGIAAWEPADMTVSVGAGTACADLAAELAAAGQEVPLDPRSDAATVGGVLACGLSGIRRLRHGPVRDHVLEVRFVTGDGRTVKGGGPTVKNVTGYDLPRLMVGSLGTLGVLEQVTLRCRPRPRDARWFATPDGAPLYRPSARLWSGSLEAVLLEGVSADIDEQARAFGLTARDGPPPMPDGPHRGRVSVAPARVRALAGALPPSVRWCAELGVGTVHVAADTADDLTAVRRVAHDHGGWMLREAGGALSDDGYGRPVPNAEVMRRIKDAFDPAGRLNPGRLPL